MGDIPENWDNEMIDKICNNIKKILSDTKEFEKNINYIIQEIEKTQLSSFNIVKTNQKILYSPINKVIPKFDDFCLNLSKKELLNAKPKN